MYGTGFIAESLARVGARIGMWKPGIKIGSDLELRKVERMVEGDLGGGYIASGGFT